MAKVPPVKKKAVEPVEAELPLQIDVVHKTSGKKFLVSRKYYLDNMETLEVA